MITEEQRRRHVLGFEGQTMAFAGQYGFDEGRAHAQCVIDGAANALVRMDGAKDTATFLFAVADRAAGGIREPTELPAALLPPPPAAPMKRRLGGRGWRTWPWQYVAIALAFLAGALFGRAF